MARLLITGASGLVGSAIVRHLTASGHECVAIPRSVDLTDRAALDALFLGGAPDVFIHAAAKVGGINRNMSFPGQMFYDNVLMNCNVIDACKKFGVKHLIAFGSNCSFPDKHLVYREDLLQDGPPSSFHEAYAYAKRMVQIQIKAYNKQYGTKFMTVIPSNMFGINDNFNLELGHVVPSLIRKCYEAKRDKKPFVVWGDGTPLREFVYVNDVAAHISMILYKLSLGVQLPDTLLLPVYARLTIGFMARLIADKMEYDRIEFDSSMPNGQLARHTDSSFFSTYVGKPSFTPIHTAVKETIDWFKDAMDRKDPKLRL